MPSYIANPTSGAAGAITVPGDKSISHRALMLGAVAEGVTVARGFLESEDCLATMNALRALGVQIERPGPQQVRITGVGLHGLQAPSRPLDMGNAGTAMRLMAGLLSGQPFDSELVGDASLMKRPMERVAAPLRSMGAEIQTVDGRPPLRIRGGRVLKGIHYEMPLASAQVKSAVLLAGLYAHGDTTMVEPAITRDHSERMLVAFGTSLSSSGGRITLRPPQRLSACSLEVPGDFSSAAFFLVAASIGAQDMLTIRNVGINPTRTGLLDILGRMGAELRLINHRSAGAEPVADIEVRAARLHGIRVPPGLVPLAIDEMPALFIAAACAEGETLLTGAAELRVKESDRIAVMAEGLQALGVEVEVLPDGLRVQGKSTGPVFKEGVVDSHGDHRIAMAFAMASLRASGAIKIRDTANVSTSFPGFVATARAIGLDLVEHPE